MRGNNFRDLIKDEMVNRFQDVVRNEINQYNLEKQESNIRLNRIELQLTALSEYLDALKYEVSQMFDDVSNLFLTEKTALLFDFDEQRRFIRLNSDAITSHIKESNTKMSECVRKDEFEHVFLSIQDKIRDINISAHNEKEKICEILHKLKNEIADTIFEESKKHEKNFDNFLTVLEEQEKEIESLYESRETFTRELAFCKKKAFVQEKNIENLYTQIAKLKAGKI